MNNHKIKIAKTIGQRIHNRRNTLGLSLEYVANHLSLESETIDKWEKDQSIPFADQLVSLADVIHSDILWLIGGHSEFNYISNTSGSQLYSWATDVGNCKLALSNVMDCIPQELHAMGTLTIIFEKLDDLQETICKQADKINS